MRIKTVICALALLIPLTAHAALISGIAAVVNDEVITTYDVEREAAALVREAEKKGALDDDARARLRATALNRLIDKKLVEQKIRELDIKVSEEEVRQSIEDVKKQNKLTQEQLVAALRSQGLTFEEYRAQLKEQLERLRLISQEVRAKIQVGEREQREYYEANRARYGGEENFRARHIFLRVPKEAKAEEVKRIMATALEVLNEARSGKEFAELAKKYSDDPSAREGGDLGTFRKGEVLADFAEAVEKMKPGEVSDLISTPAGFHIIKLEERSPGRVKPFEEVKGEIEELLYKAKSEERFSQWVNDLKKGASIEIKQGLGTGD